MMIMQIQVYVGVPGSTPVSSSMREGPHTLTLGSNIDAIHHLTDTVGQFGAQIGESIIAKLVL